MSSRHPSGLCTAPAPQEGPGVMMNQVQKQVQQAIHQLVECGAERGGSPRRWRMSWQSEAS